MRGNHGSVNAAASLLHGARPAGASVAPVPGRRWLTVLVFLLAAVLVLIALWDWNWFKGPVERAVQARTGRALQIGNLDVDLGRTSTLRADAITFANARWAKQPNMATADRVEIDVRLWPLLRGAWNCPKYA